MTVASGSELRSGGRKSCGCLRTKYLTKGTRGTGSVTDKGSRFGRLTVTLEASSLEIHCQCDCGNSTVVRRSSLTLGYTKSCGCFQIEVSKARGQGDLNTQLRTAFREVSRAVKIRDNFTCVLCGVRGAILHTHHIEPWSKTESLRFDPLNLVTLCKPCHLDKAHNGAVRGPLNTDIAAFLKQHVFSKYGGGEVEKHGTLELTEEEQLLILSGVIPERIKRNWDDLSLSELQQTVNRLRNKG